MSIDKKSYTIEFEESASDDLDGLTKKVKAQVLSAIEKLEDGPRSGNVKKLKGYDNLYRLRSGDYRVIYTIEDDVLVVLIVAIGNRRDIYELLKRRIS
jgi:mRNA interferase RelE/StbE